MAEEVAATGDGDGDVIQDMDATTVVDKRKPDVWAVSGIDKDALSAVSTISVSLAENGLSLQLEGKEPQAWATASDDMLGVAVVNNYNNAIVCMKTFMYVDGELQLFK